MRKLILSGVLTAAAVFLPSPTRASWLSEALQRRGNDRREVVVSYSPPVAQYVPPAPVAQPVPYSPAPAAVAYGDQITGVTDRLAVELRNLREDVDVELRDARGQALAGQADNLLEQIEHLQKAVRGGASPEHLQEHAGDLAKSLHEFLEATEALGRDGRFLNRSAQRIHDLDHALLKLLGPATNP